MNITVSVKQANTVTASDVASADLVYISSGSKVTNASATTTYSSSNDIPDDVAVKLYNRVATTDPRDQCCRSLWIIPL